MIQLKYNRSALAYQAFISPADRSAQVRFNNKPLAASAVIVACGFKPDRSINPDTGEIVFNHYFTKSDSCALKLALAGDYVIYDENMAEVLTRVSTLQQSSNSTDADLVIPENAAGYTPRGYQKAGVKHLTHLWNESQNMPGVGQPLIGDEVGLGKTGIVLMGVLMTPWMKNILIVCPATLKENWRREIGIWLNTGDPRFCEQSVFHPNGYRIRKTLIHTVEKGKEIIPRCNVVIANYDMVKNGNILSQLKGREWDLIITDESHLLKNASTDRSRAFYQLTGKAKVAMTATLVDKTEHAFPVLRWLHPAKFSSLHQFRADYVIPYNGARKLGEDLRSTVMLRRRKVDVAQDLPPQIRYIRRLEPEGELKKLIGQQMSLLGISGDQMDRVDEELLKFKTYSERKLAQAKLAGNLPEVQDQISAEFREVMGQFTYLEKLPFEQISKIRRDLAVAKSKDGIERIKELLTEKQQLVVIYHHRELGDAIAAAFPQMIARVDGQTHDRQAQIDKFVSGEKRIFLGSIGACATGINLQCADFMLQLERDWNATVNDQVEGRIHRIGQKFTCTYEILMFANSLDERMAQIHSQKAAIAELVMA